MNGTGWRTLDFHGYSRAFRAHEIHVGSHYDGFTLRNRRFAATDWRDGPAGALTQLAKGHTRTLAVWAEDRWTLAPRLSLTLGGRYEWWKAYGGRNFSASPALDVAQPTRTAQGFSPKGSLRWEPANRWSLQAVGCAGAALSDRQ